jgi:hypothetical protein
METLKMCDNLKLRAELYKRLGLHADAFSAREKTTINGFIDTITSDKPVVHVVEEEKPAESEAVKGVFPIGH